MRVGITKLGTTSGKSRWVCGRHATKTALVAGNVQELKVVVDTNRDLCAKAKARGIPIDKLSLGKLSALVAGVRHQGVVALCAVPRLQHGWRQALDGIDNPLLVVLDQVQDPRNLGACMRTAAALGVQAVIVPKHRSAGLTLAARKVAAGGDEHVLVDTVVNIAHELQLMRERGLLVIGADATATQDIHALDHVGPLALVMGGEAKGIRSLTLKQCDVMVRIPLLRADVIASLNVAVACGICLSAICHARSRSKG